MEQGNLQEALTAYAQGGLEVFTDAAWHFALGQLLEKAKDYPQAAHFYAQAWDFNPQQANYAYRLGRAHQQNQDYDSAIAAYRQALALAPNHADTLICLARSLQEAQQPEQAAPVFRQLLALDGADADKHRHTAHYQLGCILAGQGQHSAALQSLGAALQLQPQHAPSWLAQARSQQALGQYPQALNSLVQACAVQPKHTAALLALAQLRMCNGPFAGAAQVWEQLLAQQPTNTDWLQQHAVALDMAGQQLAAIAAYQKLHAQLLIEEKHQTTHKTPIDQAQNAIDSEVISAAAVDSYITAYGHLRDKNYPLAQNSFRQALEQAGALAPAHWHYRLAQALHLGGLALAAEAPIQQAMALQPGNTYYAAQFALIIRKQNRTWQEVEALQHTLAIAQSPANPNPNSSSIVQWQWELGEAQDKMNRFAEAASAYQQANQVQPGDALRHFTEGYAWERAGDAHQAAQAYAAAIAADQTLGAAQWGIGVFHQERGFWAQAALAYASQLRGQPGNAQLSYRLGLAQARSNHWQEAVASYRQSLVLDLHQPMVYFELGLAFEQLGQWSLAAQAYSQAVARSPAHQPCWYQYLGNALAQAGEDKNALAAYAQVNLLATGSMQAIAHQGNQAEQSVLEYTTLIDSQVVQPQWVMYESFAGNSASCNPLAICLAIIDAPAFAGWTHIWTLDNSSLLPPSLQGRSNVIVVPKESQLYRRYLASAGWLINNNTFPGYFICRSDQKYLNTWHGTPLKTLGHDMQGRWLEHKNAARNFLQATHLLSPNAHTSAVMLDSHGITGLYGGQFMEGGYPRADLTVAASAAYQQTMRSLLQLDPCRPVVLYAPTWRGTLGSVDFDIQRLQDDLAALHAAGHQVLFRGHSLAQDLIRSQAPHITLVPGEIDTSSLLSIVDVLITDYSSTFFEFISLRRPILYYAYDQEQYLSGRGTYFALEEMPGQVCTTQAQLLASLQTTDHWMAEPSMQAKYDSACEKFCPHDDGQATARTVAWFFHGQDLLPQYASSTTLQDTTQTVLLFCGPFMGNGITSAALNLCRLAASHGIAITLVVEPGSMVHFPDRIERLAQLGAQVHVLGRVGRLAYTPREKWLLGQYTTGRIDDAAIVASLDQLYRREFIRCFGRSRIRAAINFEGYSHFWVELFARAGTRTVIYQHSDMHNEYKLKFPYLQAVFRAYTHYDAIASVSPAMCAENTAKLAVPYEIAPERFTWAINPLEDTAILRAKAQQPLDADIAAWLARGAEGRPCFLSVGRLSPEKRPDKLLAAFTLYRQQGGTGRLVIAGDGPLRKQVDEQVAASGYASDIFLAGYRMHPYPLFRAADCFVLSSDHEGQPITLLESLQLQLPAIATDLPSTRAVLGAGRGHLVDNSASGLAQAMHDFAHAQRSAASVVFDTQAYQTQAWQEFLSLLASNPKLWSKPHA